MSFEESALYRKLPPRPATRSWSSPAWTEWWAEHERLRKVYVDKQVAQRMANVRKTNRLKQLSAGSWCDCLSKKTCVHPIEYVEEKDHNKWPFYFREVTPYGSGIDFFLYRPLYERDETFIHGHAVPGAQRRTANEQRARKHAGTAIGGAHAPVAPRSLYEYPFVWYLFTRPDGVQERRLLLVEEETATMVRGRGLVNLAVGKAVESLGCAPGDIVARGVGEADRADAEMLLDAPAVC